MTDLAIALNGQVRVRVRARARARVRVRVGLESGLGLPPQQPNPKPEPKPHPNTSPIPNQDYTLNNLEFAYYTQPTSLTHLTPIRAGPTAGGSSVTVHGTGLAAFAGWGAPPAAARCRWDGTQVTIPTALTAGYVVCTTAP